MKPKTTAKIVDLLKKSKRILITTHEYIDHDAVCSALLLYQILTKHLKKKNVSVIVQQDHWPQFLAFDLPGLPDMVNIELNQPVNTTPFDLVCTTDAQDIGRCLCTSEPLESVALRTVAFDHHPISPRYPPAFMVNDRLSATCEQLYRTFKNICPTLKSDPEAAYLAQIGIIADTSRFMYSSVITPQTFRTFAELYACNTINIEEIFGMITKYTRRSIYIFAHIVDNLVMKENMGYSFISRDFYTQGEYTQADLESVKTQFLQNYLRSIEGIDWGFLVRPIDKPDTWTVHFRAKGGTTDVGAIAQKLGGGGHPAASSGTVIAKTPQEVVKTVLKTIQASNS